MGIVGHWTVVRMGIAQDCLRRQGAWWEGDDCTEQTKRLLGRLDARLLWIREAVYSSCAECAASCRQPRRSACDSGLRIGHWTVDSRLGLRLPAQDRALLDSSEGCAFGGKEARSAAACHRRRRRGRRRCLPPSGRDRTGWYQALDIRIGQQATRALFDSGLPGPSQTDWHCTGESNTEARLPSKRSRTRSTASWRECSGPPRSAC